MPASLGFIEVAILSIIKFGIPEFTAFRGAVCALKWGGGGGFVFIMCSVRFNSFFYLVVVSFVVL